MKLLPDLKLCAAYLNSTHLFQLVMNLLVIALLTTARYLVSAGHGRSGVYLVQFSLLLSLLGSHLHHGGDSASEEEKGAEKMGAKIQPDANIVAS